MPTKGQIVVDDVKELKLALLELRHAAIRVSGEFDLETESLISLREQIKNSFTIVQNYNARQLRRTKGAEAESGAGS